MKIIRQLNALQLRQPLLKSTKNDELQPITEKPLKSNLNNAVGELVPSSELLSKLEKLSSEDTKRGEDAMALDPVTGQYIPADEWAKKYNEKTILEVTIVTPTDDDTARVETRYMSATDYLREFGHVVNPPKATVHSQGKQQQNEDLLSKLKSFKSEDSKRVGDMALDPITGQHISADEWAKKYNEKTILEVTIVTPTDDDTARVETRYMSATDYLKEFGNVANPPKATIHSQGIQKK